MTTKGLEPLNCDVTEDYTLRMDWLIPYENGLVPVSRTHKVAVHRNLAKSDMFQMNTILLQILDFCIFHHVVLIHN